MRLPKYLFAKVRIIFQIAAFLFNYFTFCYHFSIFLIKSLHIYTKLLKYLQMIREKNEQTRNLS